MCDGRAREWEIESGVERQVEHEAVNHQIAFQAYTKNNELLGGALGESEPDTLRIVNLRGGTELGTLPKSVTWVQFCLSPDGKRAISALDDGLRRGPTLWDVTKGAKIVSRSLPGRDSPLVAFLSNGTPIAVAAHDNRRFFHDMKQNHLLVLDLESGKEIYELVEKHDLMCIGVSAEADRMAVRQVGTINGESEESFLSVRKMSTGEEIFRTAAPREVLGAASFSADGRIIATRSSGHHRDLGQSSHSVAVWDVSAQKRLDSELEGHRAPVRSIAFSPDGKLLASASPDGSLRLWDIGTGKESNVLADWVVNGRGVSISPDGTLVAATCGGFYEGRSSIGVWHIQPTQPGFSLPVAYISDSASVSFSKDGKYLASGARWPRGGWTISGLEEARSSGSIEVWDRKDLERFPLRAAQRRHWTDATPATEFHARGTMSDYKNDVSCVGFSHDGQMLAAVGADSIGSGALTLWKLPEGELICEIKLEKWYVGQVAFSPNGKFLATTSSYNIHEAQWFQPREEIGRGTEDSRRQMIDLWISADGTLAKTLKGHRADVGGVAFSPDGRHLASASLDGTVGIWAIPDGRLITRLEGHTGGVLSVAFSPDGKLLASGSADTTILIWDFAGAVSHPK
jgi:WD40 repeat protein